MPLTIAFTPTTAHRPGHRGPMRLVLHRLAKWLLSPKNTEPQTYAQTFAAPSRGPFNTTLHSRRSFSQPPFLKCGLSPHRVVPEPVDRLPREARHGRQRADTRPLREHVAVSRWGNQGVASVAEKCGHAASTSCKLRSTFFRLSKNTSAVVAVIQTQKR